MTSSSIEDLIAQGRDLLAEATPEPWLEPHFGDSSVKCECRSIVSECYAGAIATIEVNNGLSIRDGGNDAPPYDEAVANGRLICFARNHLSRLLDELEAAREALKALPDVLVLEELRELDAAIDDEALYEPDDDEHAKALDRLIEAQEDRVVIRDHLRHFDWRTFFGALFSASAMLLVFDILHALLGGK